MVPCPLHVGFAVGHPGNQSSQKLFVSESSCLPVWLWLVHWWVILMKSTGNLLKSLGVFDQRSLRQPLWIFQWYDLGRLLWTSLPRPSRCWALTRSGEFLLHHFVGSQVISCNFKLSLKCSILKSVFPFFNWSPQFASRPWTISSTFSSKTFVAGTGPVQSPCKVHKVHRMHPALLHPTPWCCCRGIPTDDPLYLPVAKWVKLYLGWGWCLFLVKVMKVLLRYGST